MAGLESQDIKSGSLISLSNLKKKNPTNQKKKKPEGLRNEHELQGLI